MLNTKVDCNESGGTHDSRATRREHKEQHKIHTSKNKSEATTRRGHTRLKLGEGPPGCLGSVGEGCMHAKPGTRLGSEPRTAPPRPPPHAHTLTQAYTATRPGIGTNNKVVLGTTESTCVAYVGPAAARTQRSVSYASDGDFFIAYGLPTAHSKTHVDCPREVRNLRKVIDNGFFLWVHESSRTSAPVGCRSSRRG